MENNTTNFVNNPDQKMQRYASGDEKATRASPSGHFEAEASQCHLLRKWHEIRKNVLMKASFHKDIFPDFSRFQIYLVKLIRAQGGCLGTKSR